MLGDPVVLTLVVGFGLFLWLGLYLLLRVNTYTPTILAGVVGLVSQAAFFGFRAYIHTTPDLGLEKSLERASWWTTVLPVAAWFHFSSTIAQKTPFTQSKRPANAFPPAVILVYIAAAAITLFGTATDLFLRYDVSSLPPERQLTYVGPGPLYWVYFLYVGLVAGGAFVTLVRALRIAAQGGHFGDRVLAGLLRLLSGGAALFLMGALWISFRVNWDLALSVVPGYICLLGGLGGLGYGVARFGLLLEGENIRRDFGYNLLGIGLLVVLYVGTLEIIEGPGIGGILALVGLTTITHAAFDRGRDLLDRLFFAPAERTARAEARDYADALGTSPVATPSISPPSLDPEPRTGLPSRQKPQMEAPPPAPTRVGDFEGGDEKAFKDLVRKAVTGIKSPAQLAKSPLLGLKLIEVRVRSAEHDDNRLNRVATLRELLIEQIDGLRPTEGTATGTGEAWRYYNVLFYPYVRELSRKGAFAEARRLEQERRRRGVRAPDEVEQVLHWLADIDEDTFYKWQRRASDIIATNLWEENAKVLGTRLPQSAGLAAQPLPSSDTV